MTNDQIIENLCLDHGLTLYQEMMMFDKLAARIRTATSTELLDKFGELLPVVTKDNDRKKAVQRIVKSRVGGDYKTRAMASDMALQALERGESAHRAITAAVKRYKVAAHFDAVTTNN